MDLHDGEQIKQIAEFPNYWITSHGRVYSMVSNKWLKPTISKRGNYQRMYVSLGRGNKRYIHQLVAKAFIENPNNYLEVDHKDTNGLNNHVDNLRWVTHQENMSNEQTKENVKKNTGYFVEIEYIPTGEKFWGYDEASKQKNVNRVTIYNHTRGKVKNPKWKLTGERKNPNFT